MTLTNIKGHSDSGNQCPESGWKWNGFTSGLWTVRNGFVWIFQTVDASTNFRRYDKLNPRREESRTIVNLTTSESVKLLSYSEQLKHLLHQRSNRVNLPSARTLQRYRGIEGGKKSTWRHCYNGVQAQCVHARKNWVWGKALLWIMKNQFQGLFRTEIPFRKNYLNGKAQAKERQATSTGGVNPSFRRNLLKLGKIGLAMN